VPKAWDDHTMGAMGWLLRRTSSLSGLGSGLDVVWRPTAEEAHADWEMQVELPALAPIPGDKGRIHDGRIVIHTEQH